MAGGKEIRTKIKSVKSTQKITKAMQMVAASKMRKSQERMAAARPYADKIRAVIGHLAQANPDYKHPFLQQREEIRRVGYIVISTDRGLAGGLNINLFRRVLAALRAHKDAGQTVEMCLIGSKAMAFFRRLDVKIVASTSGLGDTPHIADLIGAVKVMLDAYCRGEIDQLLLAHNVFQNTMTQRPEITRLLPVETLDKDQLQAHWDYIYEPDAADLLDGVLMRYIEMQVHRAAMENVACEMAARMVAMKSATDNADKIIGNLQLMYNKARQAAITQELSEIVSGAAAV
jgi:F-type H+-transporting ATPase subunit gamma